MAAALPRAVGALGAIAVALVVLVTHAALAQGTVATTRSSATSRATDATKRGRKTAPAPAAKRPPPATVGDPQDDQARQTQERDRLTARIADLRRQIADGERSRSGAAASLARAERALSDVNQRLAELARRQKATQDLVASLDRQRVGTEGQIATGERELARTATRWYADQDRDPLQTWLAGGIPDDAVLTDGYLGYIARAEAAEVDGLRARAAELAGRRRRADDDSRALVEQAEAQRAARETLASDQAAQRQALAQLSQKLAAQKTTAAALEADEKRLTRVVEQLQRVLEQRAAEERARREAAKRVAEQQAAAARKRNDGALQRTPGRTPSTRPDSAPPIVDDAPDVDAGSSAFARLRGRLRWPVRGTVTGRFGTARGDGGATWKGVFLRTDGGADVHAVADGTVIFADDLRGFGNLLIVDHGGQYLSIYGNNDSLAKRTGDKVQSGDVIAHAGNSSGDDRTGLYFELRFRGRPFDPQAWLGSR